MHYCAVVILPKDLDISEGREIMGEHLINLGYADWYSSGDYRERKFEGGMRSIPLKEFKNIFKGWLKKIKRIPPEKKYFFNDSWCFGAIDRYSGVSYLSYFYGAPSFGEFVDPEIRRGLINKYVLAYKKETLNLIDRLLETDVEYYVTLLDYHN